MAATSPDGLSGYNDNGSLPAGNGTNTHVYSCSLVAPIAVVNTVSVLADTVEAVDDAQPNALYLNFPLT